MVKNLETESVIRKIDFLTLTSKILSNHLIDVKTNIEIFVRSFSFDYIDS